MSEIPPVYDNNYGSEKTPGHITDDSMKNLASMSKLLAWLSLLFAYFTSIPAVVIGHIVLNRVSKAPAYEKIRKDALSGIIIGYISIVISTAFLSYWIIRSQELSVMQKTTDTMMKGRNVAIAIKAYADRGDGKAPHSGEVAKFETSNAYLRMLFAKNIVRDESWFYLPWFEGANFPDGDIKGEKALAKGENVFGYVYGIDFRRTAESTPILMAPIVKRGDACQIDLNLYGGKVVVIRANGSAKAYEASSPNLVKDPESGKVIFKDGRVVAIFNSGQTKELPVLPPDL